MNIPKTLTAGDTFSWTDSLSDYPATTWTLKYVLYRYGQAVISIAAAASGNDHDITVSAATTAGYAAGEWNWTAYAEKGSGGTYERETIATGKVTIKPNVSVATAITDLRSHAQKMLDAIEATLQGRATHADLSLTINGRSIQYLKPEELLRLRSIYRREVQQEKDAENTAKGLDSSKRILTRFSR